ASYANLGAIYAKLGRKNEARNSLANGLTVAKEIGSKETISECYQNLSLLDSLTGNYKGALQNFKLSIVYKDSMMNEENNRQIAKMKTQYETEKKDKEISLLSKDKEVKEAEIKKQKLLKNSFIGGLIFTLLLFFFGYRSYRARQVLRLQTIR